MAVLQLLEALATPHGVDRYLELVNPMLTVRELRAELTDVRRPTADSVTLTLRPTRQWRGFRAGQFVQITVDIDGVRRTRCYSPACSQYRADGKIELTVRAHHGGLVSRYLYANARPGMVLGLAQADGTFVLPEQRPDRILLISGGSGITPVMSMLRTLREENYAGELAFLHYCDSTADLPYLDELAGLDGVVLATTRTSDGQLTGRFGQEHLDAVAPWFADAQTYLCGPPALMAAVREHYRDLGVADRLHTEDFQPVPIVSTGEATGTVTFERSGTAAANSGDTLLVQAEAAGLNPEYGCRMGICFSCTQVKTSGCTRNIRTGELNSDPDVEVQLCINAPVGDVALDI
ncbi:MAG TPA: FAD-binding oxidoreductase [Jatrophihabitantaceae bacterium]|nr:FAD-binding oxidoreductase [Jatrophihabitantaceae bacterium]